MLGGLGTVVDRGTPLVLPQFDGHPDKLTVLPEGGPSWGTIVVATLGVIQLREIMRWRHRSERRGDKLLTSLAVEADFKRLAPRAHFPSWPGNIQLPI